MTFVPQGKVVLFQIRKTQSLRTLDRFVSILHDCSSKKKERFASLISESFTLLFTETFEQFNSVQDRNTHCASAVVVGGVVSIKPRGFRLLPVCSKFNYYLFRIKYPLKF